MADETKEEKINWIKLLWIPVLVGLILLTFEKFAFDPLAESKSEAPPKVELPKSNSKPNPKPHTPPDSKDNKPKTFQKKQLDFQEGKPVSLEDFGLKPGRGAWLLTEKSHPESMNSYTDWSKNDVILIQGTKEWDDKIVPTSLEQIKEDTYQIGYGTVDLPEYDSNNKRIMAGTKLDTYYKNYYQKWDNIGRCFMIIPKGSVDFNKRIIIYRPNGILDYDSHKQPLEGEQ